MVPSRSTARDSVPGGSSGALSGGKTKSLARQDRPGAGEAREVDHRLADRRQHAAPQQELGALGLAALKLLDHGLGVLGPGAKVREDCVRASLPEARETPRRGPSRAANRRDSATPAPRTRTAADAGPRAPPAARRWRAPRARRRRSTPAPRARVVASSRATRISNQRAGFGADHGASGEAGEGWRGAGFRRAGARGRAPPARER